MKGISEIIATILMLMITLGISGTAYVFISGAFTQQTQGLQLVDAFCIDGSPDNSTIVLKNIGTSSVTTSNIQVIQTSQSQTVELRWSSVNVAPNDLVFLYDACEGSETRTCEYRVIPVGGRSLSAPVQCT